MEDAAAPAPPAAPSVGTAAAAAADGAATTRPAPDIDWQQLAAQFVMAGGYIKKAALQKHPVLWKRYRERAIFGQLGGATFLNSAAGLAAIDDIDPMAAGEPGP